MNDTIHLLSFIFSILGLFFIAVIYVRIGQFLNEKEEYPFRAYENLINIKSKIQVVDDELDIY